jgi:hypothetical protein
MEIDENSEEEGEDEFVSDEGEAPEAVPIGSKAISHEKKDK